MSIIGKAAALKPTEGAYQKDKAGIVTKESPTTFTVVAEGERYERVFRKDSGLPFFKKDQVFPIYRAEVK